MSKNNQKSDALGATVFTQKISINAREAFNNKCTEIENARRRKGDLEVGKGNILSKLILKYMDKLSADDFI
jgi:hypothetical protein